MATSYKAIIALPLKNKLDRVLSLLKYHGSETLFSFLSANSKLSYQGCFYILKSRFSPKKALNIPSLVPWKFPYEFYG